MLFCKTSFQTTVSASQHCGLADWASPIIQHQHPIRATVWVQDAPLLTLLPTKVPSEAEDGPVIWAPPPIWRPTWSSGLPILAWHSSGHLGNESANKSYSFSLSFPPRPHCFKFHVNKTNLKAEKKILLYTSNQILFIHATTSLLRHKKILHCW